jgi:hypothetical protein
LRSQFPDLRLLVGRWGLKGGIEEQQKQLQAIGADHLVTSLREARDHLTTWLPVLQQAAEESSDSEQRLEYAKA